ncbi:MAG: flagellar hook-length control protein FliK [Pseudomonadota bacterium]
MNGNPGLSNVLVTAPKQQLANNTVGARIHQDDSSSHFQKTLNDLQAAKAKKAKAADITTAVQAKQKLIKNNAANAASNSSQAKDTVRQKNFQSTEKAHKRVKELQHSAGDSKQIAREAKVKISDKNKVNSESDAEGRQENTEHCIAGIAAPIANDINLGLDVLNQTTLPEGETGEIGNSISGSLVFSSTLIDQVLAPEAEGALLNPIAEGTTATAQLSINTANTSENFESSANAPLSPYQANASAKAQAIETQTESIASVLSATLRAKGALDSTVTASPQNSLSSSSIFKGDGLFLADQETVNAPLDSKSLFEKMVQTVSANAMSTNNNGLEQTGAETGKHSPASTAAPLVSALDSLSRGPDSLVAAGRSFVAQTAIPVSVGQPQWSQAVGEKVLWLAAQNITAAEIRLDPPELGPMQVKVSVNQEQASVSFTSHHAGVREVLDQNLSRLRDMFNEQGLNLVNVDVSDKSFHRQQGDGKGAQSHGGTVEQVDDETLVSVSAIVQQRLVDHYA